MALRIGHGYDLHRLEAFPPAGKGKALVLGGVTVAHDLGVVAHSDGDALYHAITDAILGALALPDIGQMFPDSDPRYASADSGAFLAAAGREAASRGWRIVNIDATLVLERPKVGPVKEGMRGNIARVLGIELGQVNVKGKTHERVDAVGEGRAVEAHAVVLLERGSGG